MALQQHPFTSPVFGQFYTEPLARPDVRPLEGPSLGRLNHRMRLLEQSQKRRGVDLPKQHVPLVSGGVLTEVRIARTVKSPGDAANQEEADFLAENGPFLVCFEMGFFSGQEPDDPEVYTADPDRVLFVFPAHHQPIDGFRVTGPGGHIEIFDASDDEAVFLVLTNQHGVSRLMTGHGLAPFIQPPQDGEICS